MALLTVSDEENADGCIVLRDGEVQVFHDIGQFRSSDVLPIEVVSMSSD